MFWDMTKMVFFYLGYMPDLVLRTMTGANVVSGVGWYSNGTDADGDF